MMRRAALAALLLPGCALAQDSQVDPGCPILDTTAPQTTLADEPRKSSRNRHATFGFTSNEPGSSFECSLDGGDSSFAPCTSPLRLKVKRGGHVFRVRATDPAGNRDGTPAVSIWKVKKKK